MSAVGLAGRLGLLGLVLRLLLLLRDGAGAEHALQRVLPDSNNEERDQTLQSRL